MPEDETHGREYSLLVFIPPIRRTVVPLERKMEGQSTSPASRANGVSGSKGGTRFVKGGSDRGWSGTIFIEGRIWVSLAERGREVAELS